MRKPMNKSLAVSSSILFLIVISLMIHFISKGLPAENHSGNAEAADILQNQANVISKYNTPYSIGYQKSGYRQLYFFASPVRYQDNEKHYHTINSTIASDSQDGYADMVKKSFASNYISLQQKNKRMVIHMPPKVGMVQTNSIVHHDTISAYQYSDEKMDYYCHSSNSGIVVEADVKGDQNACRLWLDIPDSEIIHNGQYVRLIQEDGKEILISFPLCYAEESGDYYLNNTVQITKEENGYTLQLNPDEQAQGQQKVKMVFSIHYYVEKVMYDSPINEKNSTLNQIYQEYTAIGRHSGQEYGTLLRFDFKNITPKDADHLISAKYYFKVIGGDADNMSLSFHRVMDDWCAWTVTWDSKPRVGESIAELSVEENGWYSVDLTKYVKECIQDGYGNRQRYGLYLHAKTQEEGIKIIASADNSLFPPYLEIKFN